MGLSQRPLPDDTQQPQETDIHAQAGFESAVSPSERLQTHALDSEATSIGHNYTTLHN